MKPGAKKAAIPALLVSVALHALFWLVASRVRPPAPPVVSDVVGEVQVEIIEKPAPVAPAPIATAPEPEPTTPPAPRKREPKPRRPEIPAEKPVGQGKATETAEPEATLGLRFPDAPVLPAGPGGGVPLPNAAQLARAGVSVEAEAGAATPEGKRESSWARNLKRREREEAGRAVVEGGRAPAEAFDLGREIERRYQNSEKLVIELAKATAGKSRSVGRWLGRFLGGFGAHDPTEAGKPFEADRAFNRAMDGAGLEFVSRVCLTFDANGQAKAEIDGGSQVSEPMDRMAVELVLQAAQRRPGLGHASRACYRLSARLARVPPVPVFACGLSANLRPECIWPLKEVTRTKVVLDGVELSAQGEVGGQGAAAVK